MERLENSVRRKERNYRALVGYACRDQNDLEPLADHPPLGKILADRARRGIVTTVTMAECADITAVSVTKAGVVENMLRTEFGCNRTFLDFGRRATQETRGAPPQERRTPPRLRREATLRVICLADAPPLETPPKSRPTRHLESLS